MRVSGKLIEWMEKESEIWKRKIKPYEKSIGIVLLNLEKYLIFCIS